MEFIDKLKNKEQKELLSLIDLKLENELLDNYLRNNKLPFCLKCYDVPFEAKKNSTYLIIRLIEMIKNGDLILKDNAKI